MRVLGESDGSGFAGDPTWLSFGGWRGGLVKEVCRDGVDVEPSSILVYISGHRAKRTIATTWWEEADAFLEFNDSSLGLIAEISVGYDAGVVARAKKQ